MQFSSIRPTDRTLSGATTLGQSAPGSDGNEGILCVSQSSSITGTSPSECFVSYPGPLLGRGLYLSAELQSVYFIDPDYWTTSIESVKYADCISVEGCDHHSDECTGYDIELLLMVRFQSHTLGECQYTLIAITSGFTLIRSGCIC